MSKLTKQIVALAMAMLLLATLATSALAEANAETLSIVMPFEAIIEIPCANGGVGESVLLTGELHRLLHITRDASGGAHAEVHENLQNVKGIGLKTGEEYVASEIRYEAFNIRLLSTEEAVVREGTIELDFRLIGQGPDSNYLVHVIEHRTFSANGEITADITNIKAECK